MSENPKNVFVSPLTRSLQRLDPKKDRAVMALYAVILCIYIFLSFLPFSSSLQKAAMSKFHLTLRPFGSWAALQFLPAMYNFQNEMYWSLEPLSESCDLPLSKAKHLSVNHYPLRMFYYRSNRQTVVYERPTYVYLRSLYRGRELVTAYLLLKTPHYVHVQLLNAYECLSR